MLSRRWPTVARGSRLSHRAKERLQLANGPLAVQTQAGQGAGFEYARQILGVAGERQLLEFALLGLAAQSRVGQREGAQSRGQVGAVGCGVRDLVDQGGQAEVASSATSLR